MGPTVLMYELNKYNFIFWNSTIFILKFGTLFFRWLLSGKYKIIDTKDVFIFRLISNNLHRQCLDGQEDIVF